MKSQGENLICTSLFSQYFCYFVNTFSIPAMCLWVKQYPVVVAPKLDLCGCLNHFFLGQYRLLKYQEGSGGVGMSISRSDSGYAGCSS